MTTIEILAPYFEQRPHRLVPNLPFAEYQRIPAVNASLLRNATPYEMLSYAVGVNALDPVERALVEMSGADCSTVLERVQDYTPRTVPVKMVRFARMPGESEKATPPQLDALATIQQAPIDSRELNAGTLKAILAKGWATTEDTEKVEAAISPAVKESRAMALAIGNTTHKAILEPHMFDSEQWQKHFQLSPTAGLTTKLALECAATDPTRELVTAEIIDTARRCRDAVWRHKLANELLSQPGESELTCEAWDEEAMCMRKCRFDRLPKDAQYGIVDVKTTHTNLLAFPFRSSVYSFGYHQQSGFYLDTAAMIEGKPREAYYIVAVTKEAPFICRVFELNRQSPENSLVEKGRDIYKERLAAFSVAWFDKQWSAYENEGAMELAA